MKRRIEVCPRLEDTEGNMDKLTYHGAEDDHSGGQTVLNARPPGGLRGGDHSGHVERFAQQGMAHLGEARFALHAAGRWRSRSVSVSSGSRA